MSRCFQSKGYRINRHLGNLAVQLITQSTSQSLEFTVRKHYYRALIHVLFTRRGIDPIVGKLPNSTYRNGFRHYVQTIVKKLQLPEGLVEESSSVEHLSDTDITTAVCLRGMCAAVVESFILLDRWLFLRENMKEGYLGLHGIFDSEISPRGWALIASR
jgi:hypothetical protein